MKGKKFADKLFWFFVLGQGYVLTTFAQDKNAGLTGLNEATTMVKSYFGPVRILIYAIAAVIGLIGAIKVYTKFSSGDPDTGKTAASWGGACVFLIVAATVLGLFFGVGK